MLSHADGSLVLPIIPLSILLAILLIRAPEFASIWAAWRARQTPLETVEVGGQDRMDDKLDQSEPKIAEEWTRISIDRPRPTVAKASEKRKSSRNSRGTIGAAV